MTLKQVEEIWEILTDDKAKEVSIELSERGFNQLVRDVNKKYPDDPIVPYRKGIYGDAQHIHIMDMEFINRGRK